MFSGDDGEVLLMRYRFALVFLLVLLVAFPVFGWRGGARAPQVGTGGGDVITIINNYTVESGHNLIKADATAGDIVVTLPAGAENANSAYMVVKTDSSVNTVTVDGAGAETISGDASYILRFQYEWIIVTGDGSNWFTSSLDGVETYPPSAVQVIDAAGDTILQNATRVELNPDANYTLTSTPHILDGTEGDVLVIVADNAEANIVTLQDQDTLGGSNVQLGAATRAITGKSALILHYDGDDWVEVNYGAGGIGDILKDIVVAGTGMSGGADDVLPGADSDVTITLTTNKDIVAAGTGMSGGEDDVLPGADADTTITLTTDKDIVVTGTGISGGEDDVLPGADADVTITLTVDKDIVVSGTGMSGGENDVLLGADADVSIALATSKDIVAGGGLTGGEDDVLPGADADTTITVGAGDGVIVNADEIEVYGLVASDGTPNDAVVTAADGDITINYNATLDGIQTYTPSAVQVIDAVGDTILANATRVDLNPDANYTLTSTPHIANGTEGDILVITMDNAEGNTVTLQDQDTLGGSNVELNATTRTIAAKTVLILHFDGSDWVEANYGAAGIGDILKDIVAAGTGMSGGEDDVLLGPDSDVTITLTVDKDLVVSGTGMGGGENDVFPGGDADVNVTLTTNKDIVVSGTGMSGGENDVLPGAEADVTIALDVSKDIVVTGTGISGGEDDVLPGGDADVTITLTVDKDIVVSGTGMGGGENDVLLGADADMNITLTTDKDIVVSGTGMSGGENDVLPGAEADVTIALDVSKDIVAGGGLTGGEDDVLPGGDADTTLAVGAGDGVIVNADEVEVYGLVASDGTPNDAVVADASGHITVNYNLTIDGVSVITPSVTQAIDAVGDTISANATLVILNPDANYTLTSTPTIANGTTGQLLFVTADNAEGFAVTIQDEAELVNTNVICKGDTTEITGKTVTSFVFDGTNWIEYGAQDVINIKKQTIINELNIPHGDDPTTDADTELAYDTNDEALEVYDGADSRLIPTVHSAEVMIFAPDGVDDEIPLFHVDAEKYPHGIELLNVQITIPADVAYSMVFEEWAGDPPAAQNDIETVTTAGTDSYMEVRTGDIDDNDIDADDYIFLHVPATDVDWILCGVFFYINDGN